MEKIDWSELSNYEIEVKLKELEFTYKKVKSEVVLKYKELESLNDNYLKGQEVIDKRLYPGKTK